MAEDQDPNYNDSHRAFLQAFLARSVFTLEEVKPVLAGILTAQEGRATLPEDITEADVHGYVVAVNGQLSRLDLEIRSTQAQSADRRRVYALVNTTSDALTQLATTHSADAIAFIKRVLDAIFETYNTPQAEVMAIRSMEAVNLARGSGTGGGGEAPGTGSAAALSKTEAQRLLDSMVLEGWFERSAAGFYSLSPRALMELRSWLVETYNEPPEEEEDGDDGGDGDGGWQRIKFCEACREIITVGQRCSNRTCTCRLHNLCTQQFFRNQPARRCPKCQAEWTGTDFVGEKAAGTRRVGR